ncbi:MAG: hypothetical protein IJA54_07690 [Tyzzerella sp.]|nr:hypothetical protein [Tyzzerella sp.]
MLQTLVDFFKSIGNVIMSLVDFVISLIQDIVFVVKICGAFVLKLPDLFVGWLPSTVVVLIIGAFSVVVIYKILGREG